MNCPTTNHSLTEGGSAAIYCRSPSSLTELRPRDSAAHEHSFGDAAMSLLNLPIPKPLQALTEPVQILVHGPGGLDRHLPRWSAYVSRGAQVALSRDPAWLRVLERGLGHAPYCLEAMRGDRTCGLLPLASVRSRLFGHFLVALPYLHSGGVTADDDASRG